MRPGYEPNIVYTSLSHIKNNLHSSHHSVTLQVERRAEQKGETEHPMKYQTYSLGDQEEK